MGDIPRLIVTGTHSGVGKTTITAGIIAALRRRGLTPQPFKVGPDYIDPTYHRLAAGQPCRNLDTWMVPPERTASLFARACRDADVAVIEGVMGLYDGFGYEEDTGSTAHVACLLAAPVVLVIDAQKMARSAGAVALGYQQFAPDVQIAGIIVNRVGSESHGTGVRRAIEQATGLSVLGWLTHDDALQVPEAHLGLVPTEEAGDWQHFIDAAAVTVEKYLDVDRLLGLAESAATFVDAHPLHSLVHGPSSDVPHMRPRKGDRPRIAVARDAAFSFYYEDNLDLLQAAGAELISFSPLDDGALPVDTEALYIGGGFPERYAGDLAANKRMLQAIRDAQAAGIPIYAECGGFMYMMEQIVDHDGVSHAGVGLVPGRAVMQNWRVRIGYCEVTAPAGNWLLPTCETARGHTFHWSDWHALGVGEVPSARAAWHIVPRCGGDLQPEGYADGNLLASYVHLHFAWNPAIASRFVLTATERHTE